MAQREGAKKANAIRTPAQHVANKLSCCDQVAKKKRFSYYLYSTPRHGGNKQAGNGNSHWWEEIWYYCHWRSLRGLVTWLKCLTVYLQTLKEKWSKGTGVMLSIKDATMFFSPLIFQSRVQFSCLLAETFRGLLLGSFSHFQINWWKNNDPAPLCSIWKYKKKKTSYYGRILIWKHFRGFMQPIANIISASEVWRWSFSTVKSLQPGWGKSLMSFSLGRTMNDERLVWKLLVVSEGWVSSQWGIQAEKDRCGNRYKVTKTTDLPNVFKNSLHWYPQAW